MYYYISVCLLFPYFVDQNFAATSGWRLFKYVGVDRAGVLLLLLLLLWNNIVQVYSKIIYFDDSSKFNESVSVGSKEMDRHMGMLSHEDMKSVDLQLYLPFLIHLLQKHKFSFVCCSVQGQR